MHYHRPFRPFSANVSNSVIQDSFNLSCLFLSGSLSMNYMNCLDIEVRTGISKSLRSYQDEVISYRIPFAKHKTFADKSCSVAGPKIWNSLPAELNLSETVN